MCRSALIRMQAGENIMNSEVLPALGNVAGALRSFFLTNEHRNMEGEEKGEVHNEGKNAMPGTLEGKEEGKESKTELNAADRRQSHSFTQLLAGRQRQLCERIAANMLSVLRALLLGSTLTPFNNNNNKNR